MLRSDTQKSAEKTTFTG